MTNIFPMDSEALYPMNNHQMEGYRISAKPDMAVWAITPAGKSVARRIHDAFPGVRVFLSRRLVSRDDLHWAIAVESLSDAVAREFSQFPHHVFIMASGIVVRLISQLLDHKTRDPAVVVMDDQGKFAISLVSGHVGGANDLAQILGQTLNAQPVITTATDGARLPAVDCLAREHGLYIENPETIKHVSMALIMGHRVGLHDPFGIFAQTDLSGHPQVTVLDRAEDLTSFSGPVVCIDDRMIPVPPQSLILRPASLSLGIGCNRNTSKAEILQFLHQVLETFSLSVHSLRNVATVDIKADEAGIVQLAHQLHLPLELYSKDQLNAVETIVTPSPMAEKYVGVKSVCEASAILASGNGPLTVPKQTQGNVTLAIARMPCTLPE